MLGWDGIRRVCGKSVLEGREVLKLGLRMDGKDIHTGGRKWLPCPSSFTAISPPSPALTDAKVDALIHPVSENWNEGVIRELFLNSEVLI